MFDNIGDFGLICHFSPVYQPKTNKMLSNIASPVIRLATYTYKHLYEHRKYRYFVGVSDQRANDVAEAKNVAIS